MIEYTIELKITVKENSIDDSDLNALVKGCKYWFFMNRYFKINKYTKEKIN